MNRYLPAILCAAILAITTTADDGSPPAGCTSTVNIDIGLDQVRSLMSYRPTNAASASGADGDPCEVQEIQRTQLEREELPAWRTEPLTAITSVENWPVYYDTLTRRGLGAVMPVLEPLIRSICPQSSGEDLLALTEITISRHLWRETQWYPGFWSLKSRDQALRLGFKLGSPGELGWWTKAQLRTWNKEYEAAR